jgi:hypothetical protein
MTNHYRVLEHEQAPYAMYESTQPAGTGDEHTVDYVGRVLAAKYDQGFVNIFEHGPQIRLVDDAERGTSLVFPLDVLELVSESRPEHLDRAVTVTPSVVLRASNSFVDTHEDVFSSRAEAARFFDGLIFADHVNDKFFLDYANGAS